MDEFYIRVNKEYNKIHKRDILEILIPLIFSIRKNKKTRRDDYSYIGNMLKRKCNDINLILYNKHKRRRNINYYLRYKYNGLENFINNHIDNKVYTI